MLKDRKRRAVVSYRIAMGEPKSNSRNAPRQLDHFIITDSSANKDGEYPPIKAVHARLGNDKPREVPFFVASDDLEDFIDQKYECRIKLRSGLAVFCSGDGEVARRLGKRDDGWRTVPCRSAPMRDDGTGWQARAPKDLAPLLANPFDDEPLASDNHRCPFAQNGSPMDGPACKPSTVMYVRLPCAPTVGSFARFKSNGHRTADSIVASLLQIREITQGVLRGVPLKLVLKRVRMSRPGGGYGIHSVAHVELAVEPEKALQLATAHLQNQAMLASGLDTARHLLEAPASPEEMVADEAEWEVAEVAEEVSNEERPSAGLLDDKGDDLEGLFSEGGE